MERSGFAAPPGYGMISVISGCEQTPMLHLLSRPWWLVGLLLLLAGCSRDTVLCSNPNHSASCADRIEAEMVDARVPGISVAIIDNHRLVSQWALGHPSPDDARTVSPITPFQAGDLSQLVTALGALAWIEQNGVSLDASVNDGLTRWQLPDNSRWSGDSITLRHLLSHRSGLTPTRFSGYEAGERQPTRQAIRHGNFPANSGPIALYSQPGASCLHSAAGYEVLSDWLEDQTQLAFTVYQGRAVFTPLNITARYRLIGLPTPALGHDWQGNTLPSGYRRFVERGSSGLWASPSDLARVLLEIMAAQQGLGRILTDRDLINQVFTSQGCGMGLGFALQRADGITEITKAGGNPGYRAYLAGQIETGKGVVIMTNGDRGDRLIDGILAAVKQDYNW